MRKRCEKDGTGTVCFSVQDSVHHSQPRAESCILLHPCVGMWASTHRQTSQHPPQFTIVMTGHQHLCDHIPSHYKPAFSTFLMLWPLICFLMLWQPQPQIILLVLHNCTFATVTNRTTHITYAGCLVGDPKSAVTHKLRIPEWYNSSNLCSQGHTSRLFHSKVKFVVGATRILTTEYMQCCPANISRYLLSSICCYVVVPCLN